MFNDPVWVEIAKAIIQKHKFRYERLERSEHGENIVFFLDDRYILKLYTPIKNAFKRERTALRFAHGKTSLPIPDILVEGEIEGYRYLINTQVGGRQITRDEWLQVDERDQVHLLQELASGLRQLHQRDAGRYDFNWREFLQIQMLSVPDKHFGLGSNPEWQLSVPKYLDENKALIPKSPEHHAFQHGDVHFGNVRVINRNGKLSVGGLFDFADSIKGFHEYEFVAIGVLMIQGQPNLQREFFKAYGYADHQIDEALRRRMMTLTLLYEYGSLKRYAERLAGPNGPQMSLEELERGIWAFA
jgi:hygromycin-B 7''-O-kinase